MKTTVTKRMTFAAGHRLYNPGFSDEKNGEIFGDCANVNAHGHNYVLYVSVSGAIDPETGMIVNLKNMKNVIQKKVIELVDHKNLNLDVAFMKDVIPTTENFAAQIWMVLEKAFRGVTLEKIVLWESENNKVEISR